MAAPVRRSDRRFLLLAVAVCLLLRFPGLLWPLTPDESGFLIVSRNWNPEALNPFGYYWVDRSPILIGFYRAADVLGESYMPRVFAAALAALLVVAAHRSGYLIGGQSAARWATVTAVALVSNPELYAWTAKGEMLGIPFVMVSCWLILAAPQLHNWRGLAIASGAGMAAVVALGMKQNLAGGVVFGTVIVASLCLRRDSRNEGLALAGAALAGAALPIAAIISWAGWNDVHLSTFWEMAYGFRADAFSAITRTTMEAELTRADTLALLFIQTGLVAIVVWFLVSLPKAASKHAAITLAVLVMLLMDGVGVVLGGSYWTAYLLPLIPPATIAVAILAGGKDYVGRLTRWIVILTSLLTAFSVVDFTISRTTGDIDPTAYHVGLAIRGVAQPHDTILPLYGRADIVHASGLENPYRYLWSLPARVRDPQLAEMRTLLASPVRPTWVVEWDPVNIWGIDQAGRLQTLLDRHYVEVAEPCGRTIWRSRQDPRPRPPAINCNESWLEIQFR